MMAVPDEVGPIVLVTGAGSGPPRRPARYIRYECAHGYRPHHAHLTKFGHQAFFVRWGDHEDLIPSHVLQHLLTFLDYVPPAAHQPIRSPEAAAAAS